KILLSQTKTEKSNSKDKTRKNYGSFNSSGFLFSCIFTMVEVIGDVMTCGNTVTGKLCLDVLSEKVLVSSLLVEVK
ncbi:MAG: hypothetical protein QN632_00855, partial [Nitrososphaeraceae archaeon]|nr:hypothetical protein [Nitrososphaeraceae archaeon]